MAEMAALSFLQSVHVSAKRYAGRRHPHRAGVSLHSGLSGFASAPAFNAPPYRWQAFPISDSLSRNAYDMYLIHYAFVVWLQCTLLNTLLFVFAKARSYSASRWRVPIGTRPLGVER
jgi:hypothetical protein